MDNFIPNEGFISNTTDAFELAKNIQELTLPIFIDEFRKSIQRIETLVDTTPDARWSDTSLFRNNILKNDEVIAATEYQRSTLTQRFYDRLLLQNTFQNSSTLFLNCYIIKNSNNSSALVDCYMDHNVGQRYLQKLVECDVLSVYSHYDEPHDNEAPDAFESRMAAWKLVYVEPVSSIGLKVGLPSALELV